MLSPVSITSTNSANLGQRDTPVAAQPLGAPTITADAAVALALAANSEVEGKLNMILLGVRERMIDSLLAVIAAVGKSLNMQQAAGETNVDYAARLATAIGSLDPKVAATVQLQLNAQGPAASLALIARALQNPAGTEAAQVVAYLEVVRYKEKDLATKAVVASYGQNGAEEAQTAGRGSAAASSRLPGGGQTIATAMATQEEPSAANPAAIPAMARPDADLVPDVPGSTATVRTIAVSDIPATAEKADTLAEASIPKMAVASSAALPKIAGDADQRGVSPFPAAIAATPTEKPSQSSSTPQPVKSAEGQTVAMTVTDALVAKDPQTALKVVVAQLIDATGAELMQTMAEVEPVAAKVVAQALVADMLDVAEVGALPSPDGDMPAPRITPASSHASPTTMVSAGSSQTEEPAPLAALNRLLAESPTASVAAAQPLPLQAQLPMGIPFAVGQYLPADDVADDLDALHVDHVDAVDEEDERAGRGHHRRDAEDDADEDQPDGQEQAEREASEEAEVDGAQPAPISSAGHSHSLALPRPAPMEPFRETTVNLYQRMGGWD